MKLKRSRLRRGEDEGGSMMPLMDVLFSVMAGVMFCLALAEFGNRIKVDLPTANGPSTKPPTESISVSITAAGELFVEGNATTVEGLSAAVQSARHDRDIPVIIRTDSTTDCQPLLRALLDLQRAGVEVAVAYKPG